jgi:hypothetical protein
MYTATKQTGTQLSRFVGSKVSKKLLNTRAGRKISYNNFEIPVVSGLSNIYLLFK